MLFVALAWDYDGTIAADRKVDQFTLDASAQVAENGAVLYLPKTGRAANRGAAPARIHFGIAREISRTAFGRPLHRGDLDPQ
jgi:hydroxymethylpyrimidine pyrophosphatase-like HAD family hydrolase